MSPEYAREGSLADGQSAQFEPEGEGYRLNVTAVLQPTNTFSFGKAKLNVRKGTAKLAAKVANPGKLVLTGKGLKKTSEKARRAGRVKLAVTPSGKAKRKLAQKGGFSTRARVAYKPRGGKRRTKSRRVKLKQR